MQCPACGDEIVAGAYQAQYCRMFYALRLVTEWPGLSAWELSRKDDEAAYADIAPALLKAGGKKLVIYREELREEGLTGKRYRYWPKEPEAIDEAAAIHISQRREHVERQRAQQARPA